jgi:hypothetical protein
MNGGKRFGGGRVPTGTPSLAWSSVAIVASLLAGASIVHNIYKPDMVHLCGPSTPATVHTTCSTQFLHKTDLLILPFFISRSCRPFHLWRVPAAAGTRRDELRMAGHYMQERLGMKK